VILFPIMLHKTDFEVAFGCTCYWQDVCDSCHEQQRPYLPSGILGDHPPWLNNFSVSQIDYNITCSFSEHRLHSPGNNYLPSSLNMSFLFLKEYCFWNFLFGKWMCSEPSAANHCAQLKISNRLCHICVTLYMVLIIGENV
jgi:hypothetical protein